MKKLVVYIEKLFASLVKYFFIQKRKERKQPPCIPEIFLITVKLQKQADAKSNRSSFLRPTYIGIIMQLLDL